MSGKYDEDSNGQLSADQSVIDDTVSGCSGGGNSDILSKPKGYKATAQWQRAVSLYM